MPAQEHEAHATVLVVDDEDSIRESLQMILEREGYRVEEAENGRQAMTQAATVDPDAVLLDIRMPEIDGLEVLTALRERGYDMPVLIITGHGDVATAVEATKRGAFDFFEKPLERDRVLISLRNAIENRRLAQEGGRLRQQPDDLIGSSPAMQELRATIERAAPTPATVLIVGESGTGKELVARAIHDASTRATQPLVQVNCAAIPDELIESELFGHEKGSFTGATRKQTGKFVAADGGTIFLDEVGDMSSRTQAKVLRVLQNGEVEPVGAAETFKVDVRVVAATHRDLPAEIEAGRFREDLYYRLNVVPIRTPPLRERVADIPQLVEYFGRRFSSANNYPRRNFSDEVLEELKARTWPGNVRELKNFIERLLILTEGDVVELTDLTRVSDGQRLGGELAEVAAARTLQEVKDAAERTFILRKLEEHDWNVTRTAESIETPRSNLYKKMNRFGISREDAGASQ